MPQRDALLAAQRRNPMLRIQIAAFVALALLLLPFYRYELGPDGISYLSIANQYARGYWQEAVNAYWWPLYSWLLAFLLLPHIPGLVAVRIVAIGSGIMALYALHGLSNRFRLSPLLQQVVLWLAALMLLSFVIESETPDLLFTALLLLYTAVIFHPAYPVRASGILCGVLGVLSFYTKSYGFPFFLCHFCVFNAIAYWRQCDRSRRREVLRQFGGGLASFLVLSALWIFVLHARYGIWTLGTSGEFNHRLVGPESAGYPQLRGLMPPASVHAITIWQNPSPAMLPPWSIVQNARHEMKLVALHLHGIAYFWFRESIFAPVLLTAYIALCLRIRKSRWEWTHPVVTICIFSAGYVLVTVEDRYFWYVELLLLLVAFRAFEILFEKTTATRIMYTVFAAILFLSFAIGPLGALRGHFRRNLALYGFAQTLKKGGQLSGPFASSENWAQSAYIGYLLQEPYDGVVVPEHDADEVARGLNPGFKGPEQPVPALTAVRAQLSSEHIADVLVWPDCPIDAGSLGQPVAGFDGLRVLKTGK